MAVELTERERDVAQCILEAMAVKTIARDLKMAEGTVKVHLGSLYRKLGVNTKSEAMIKLAQNPELLGSGRTRIPPLSRTVTISLVLEIPMGMSSLMGKTIRVHVAGTKIRGRVT